MSPGSTNPTVKWAAELAHVRDVSLRGTADLAYWKARLLNEDLQPVQSGGRAQILIVAADAKYRGIRFRELSFSVLVSRPGDENRGDAAYLVRAFNSCRFFAFCERMFFSTPYYHADVRVSATIPASIQLAIKGKVVFRAEMEAASAGGGREPARCGEDGWEGPIYLPETRRRTGRAGKWFFARLRGHAWTYPFLHSRDALKIERSQGAAVLEALRDSDFVAGEWLIREDAAHAKSKTYRGKAPLTCPANSVHSGGK